MAKRLFVGGLPYSTTQDELRDIFAKIGELESVTLIIDKFSGTSKGFAFVEYKDDANADVAINTLNGTKIGDRAIAVNVARPLEERAPRSFDNRGGGFGGNDRRGGGGYDQRSSKRW